MAYSASILITKVLSVLVQAHVESRKIRYDRYGMAQAYPPIIAPIKCFMVHAPVKIFTE